MCCNRLVGTSAIVKPGRLAGVPAQLQISFCFLPAAEKFHVIRLCDRLVTATGDLATSIAKRIVLAARFHSKRIVVPKLAI